MDDFSIAEKELIKEDKLKLQITKLDPSASPLHHTEQEILETLLAYSGKSRLPQIYNKRGMPTTSAFRWISSLEQKGFITREKIGKYWFIYITEQFFTKFKVESFDKTD